jgi:transposase
MCRISFDTIAGFVCVRLCVPDDDVDGLIKIKCKMCENWFTSNIGDRHHLCKTCKHERYYPSSSATSAPSSSAPSSSFSSPSLFDRPEGCIDQLTIEQRAAIITLHRIGMLAKDIAIKIPCSANTVSLWITRDGKEHSLNDKERSGRPRCTDDETDVVIEEYAEEKKFIVPKDIRRELQLECSARTVRRRLDEVNLFGRLARELDTFDDRILKLRLSFANGFLHFTDDEWDTVIFSDEVHFCLGHHGQVWVQRPPGAAYHPQYCKPHDDPIANITVWGCFCSKGMGAGRIFIGELNKQLYRDILQHNLQPTYQRYYPSGVWRLLQDNASPHYNPEVNTWMHNHGIHIIEFPPRSPDLNPIENLWHLLKWRVEHRNPRTAEELERFIGEEYEAITTQECTTLAHSMHNRLVQCIEFQGHKTKY